MPVLEFKNVSKSFGDIQAVTNISFSIEDGEFVFITGPSGAGKTTLMKLLLRQYRPSEGEIRFGDWQVHKAKKSKIPHIRQEIGAVFQDFKLLHEKTIRENAEIALAIAKVPSSEWRQRVDHILDLVGLTERADLFPSQLSGGELQRAALARSLVVNPKIVFADEPTGNLDWETAEGVMNLLLKINKEGKTVIVTTHHKTIVKEFGKRVIEMKKGEIVKDSMHSDHKEKTKKMKTKK